MILEITGDQIALLNDVDLRALVGALCEEELRSQGHSPSAVTWGGHQNAPDGGIDVRVRTTSAKQIAGYIPKQECGFQVKAQEMTSAAIKSEIAPNGIVRPSIVELGKAKGAYVLVCSKASLADTSLSDRKEAIRKALGTEELAASLTIDFYDKTRIASWVNQHPGLVPWVRHKVNAPMSGWRPFHDWSSSPTPLDQPFLVDTGVRLVGPSIPDGGLDSQHALEHLREILARPNSAVRLVGLSGVGKTRFVQALFDARIGTNPLPQHEVLYTDIGDSPNPMPQELLTRLMDAKRRVILVVDNCGNELHQRLATQLTTAECSISIITVEFDIEEDQPANTSVFKLEPASSELIERILETRFPGISYPSRNVIASAAEGNFRIALALAQTTRDGESLAYLKDAALFDRLFEQQKGSSDEFRSSAKICSLLYSFDGESLESQEAELPKLARLVGISVSNLLKHVAELERRGLVQKRGKWRALLPHALANRLAARALAEIPKIYIDREVAQIECPRMLRSFSRRVGYLHDSLHARAFAKEWLSFNGLLGDLGNLNELGETILLNVAPIDPEATLQHIEEVSARHAEWFFGKRNSNRDYVVRILRSLAYDPALFRRSATLIKYFVLADSADVRNSDAEVLKSLFWLYLSGTHASVHERANFVEDLLKSDEAPAQDLGLTLFGEMLKTRLFSSHYTFDFGARKRDYGFEPRQPAAVVDWFKRVLAIGRLEVSSESLASRIRKTIATHLKELIDTGIHDELISLGEFYSENYEWPEGWIAVRKSLRRASGKLPVGVEARLKALESALQPRDLIAMVRTYALSPEWTTLDIADDDDLEPVEARERVYDACVGLGEQLVNAPSTLDHILPEVLKSRSQKTYSIGRGIARACISLKDSWAELCTAYVGLSVSDRNPQLLAGFLSEAAARSPAEVGSLLDAAMSDVRLHGDVVYLQSSAGINASAMPRMMFASEVDTVPVNSFYAIAGGRVHEGFDDEQIRMLLTSIAAREGGAAVAVEILGMRIFGRKQDKLPISGTLKASGREILAAYSFSRKDRAHHMLGEIIEVAFDAVEHEEAARNFCARLIASINNWEVYAIDVVEIFEGLALGLPHVLLDMVVEGADDPDRSRRNIVRDMRRGRSNPLSSVPEQTMLEWALEKPSRRYELLGAAVEYSLRPDDENGPIEWSPFAIRIIELAPDATKVLDALFEQFRPNGWSGSLAALLEKRLPLLESLKVHAKPEVRDWAHKAFAILSEEITRERQSEASQSRRRDLTFE